MTEWERKTHMKPVRELRGVKLEPPTERAPMGCGSGKVQWDSKIQTRRTVRTKQASAFWAWHLQYEKENHIMYIPEAPLRYTIISHGALPSAVRPRIEHSIEQLLNREQFTTNEKRFGRNVTTRKTKIG